MTETLHSSSAVMATEQALARIAARDEAISAWVQVDGDRALVHAASIDAAAVDAAATPMPLAGLTLGVKDIIDVGGLSCECGSPIFAGRRAFSDAAVVAKLKALGMVVIGKTATAEFAYLRPPATRNPLDIRRSPGGSSSGSAAAVADGHVDAALGTQTAGSITRPAAFCGIVGFKPTYNRFSRVGVLSASPTVDTIGWLTRDVAVARRMWNSLSGDTTVSSSAIRIGFCKTVHWSKAEPAMQAAAEQFASNIAAHEIGSPPATLDDVHAVIMRHEMRQELATQILQAPGLLSPNLKAYLDGTPIPHAEYVAALKARDAFDVDALFDDVDLIITSAACGEAVPFGSTGDPCFNRFVTLLGLPSITLPVAKGHNGLPLGMQLIARQGDDTMLLNAAAVLEALLRSRP